MNFLGGSLALLSIAALAYFAAINALYLLFTGIAWRAIAHHLRARAYAAIEEAFASPLTPPVSVLLPAFNEEAGIVESVRSLLSLRYPEHEVIVVSDGSTDATIERLRDAFDLVPVRKVLRDEIETAQVRATYVSRMRRELTVVDKDNGGKADALNAGINFARFPLVCGIDADSILEQDALVKAAMPFV